MATTGVEILSIIDRLSFFNSFTTGEKHRIVSDDAHFRVYKPEEMLIRQGSSDQSLFILLTGTVNVMEGAGGTIFAALGAGDIFGEMAFLTETRRTANVIAREPVIALKLDRVLFDRLSPEIREKFKDRIIEKLVTRLDTANKDLARLNATISKRFPGSSKPAGQLPSGSSAPVFISGRELIRKIISRTSALPVMPEIMVKVQQMNAQPGTSPAQLAKVIETDPAMVAGILKVANSAYYGFRGKVSTIQHASALFGTRRLAELITAMSAGSVLGKAMAGYGLRAGDMWRHSIAVACTAGEIAAAVESDTFELAYLAGLLHDVGKIILDPYVQERKVLFDHYYATSPGKTVQDAEQDILGFNHAVIAAILCENWSLPRSIAFGIRHHHKPSSAGDHQLSHIVHLADYITVQAGLGGGGRVSCQKLDEACLSMVPLDPDTLSAAAEKARKYVESLAGRLFRS